MRFLLVDERVRRERCICSFLLVCIFPLISQQIAFGQSTAENEEAAREVRFRFLWARAAAFQDAGQHARAVSAFRGILDEFPKSQRAALRIGICEERAGLLGNAVDSYQVAIDIEPYGVWAPTSLFFQARLCKDYGCGPTARDAIEMLQKRFPESAWAVRSAIVSDQMDGVETVDAQADFDTELLAAQEYESIRRQDGSVSGADQITLLANLASGISDSGTALRARERIGHILIRQGRTNDAITAFEDLLLDLQSAAPEARIAQNARTRLAALYHADGRRQDALVEFDELAEVAADPSIRSNAMLQGAGIAMELVFNQVEDGTLDLDAAWQRVRSRCQAVLTLPNAVPQQVARAELMHLESHHWQGNRSLAVGEAEAFVNKYDGNSKFLSELATAHLVLGECLQSTGNHEQALPHYRWIVEHHGDEEPWYGIETLARARFRIFDVMCQTNVDPERVRVAAEYILVHHSGTEYAELVDNAAQQGFWTP